MTHAHRVARLLLLLALVAPIAAVAGPADAVPRDDPFYCSDTCTSKDPARDAPAKADILKAHVSTGTSAFGLTLRVRDLQRTGKLVFGAGLSGWGVNFTVVKSRHGYRVSSQTISEVQVYPAKPCPAARVTWNPRKNVVKATFPYACPGSSPDGGTIINGVDLRSGRAHDEIGHVFYKP